MREIRKHWLFRGGATVLAALIIAIGVPALNAASAGGSDPTRPIAVNQTDGFGNERLLVFTYFQNFACIHEPFDDLDGMNHTGDGKVAADDPDEFQTPKCILGDSGSGSLPTIDPTGRPIAGTEPLFVIVPFFDADGDRTVDALDSTPGVDVQCPEPGPEKPGVSVHATSALAGSVPARCIRRRYTRSRRACPTSPLSTTATSSMGTASAPSGGRSLRSS